MKESSDVFKPIIDCLSLPVIVFNSDGEAVCANSAALLFTGASSAADIGFNLFSRDGISREALSLNGRNILHVAVTMPGGKVEADICSYGDNGQKAFYFLSFQELPDEKNSLTDSVNSSLFESSRAVMMIVDPDSGRIINANPAAAEFYGWTVDELRSMHISSINRMPDEKLKSLMEQVRLTGLNRFEFVHWKKDGSSKTVEVYSGPFHGLGRIYLLSIIFDISDRKEAEENFIKAAKKIESVFRSAPAGIGIVNDRNITEANDKLVSMTGYSRDELIGANTRMLYESDEEYHRIGLEKDRIVKENTSLPLETKWVTKSGHVINVLLNYTRLNRDSAEEGATFSALDITESRLFEKKLMDSETRFRTLIENAPAAIFAQTGGKFAYLNQAALNHFGAQSANELLGHSVLERFHPDFHDKIRDRLKLLNEEKKDVPLMEQIHYKLDGTPFAAEVSAVPFEFEGENGALVFVSDISQRKQNETFMSRSQKLESLGVLAGGIAHDFNNLLGIIFGYIDLCRAAVPADSKALKYLDKALGGLNRATDLTRQLLTFSRGGNPVRKNMDILPVVREAAQFALSGSKVIACFDFENGIKPCSIDHNQFGQAVDNIVINAVQAMPDGGRLNIVVRNIENREGYYGAGDSCIKISFTDTGPGIPEDIQPKIFDPFFSTRPGGNGLGLATAYSIIKKHGGDIFLEPTDSVGTTISIVLPTADSISSREETSTASRHSGKGRVLVMDDEDHIREITCEMLTGMGYDCDEAPNGNDAIEMARMAMKNGAPYRIAIMDLTIPGEAGGVEAVTAVKNICPETITIASSGYSDNPVMASPQNFNFDDSINKPYTLQNLTDLLNRLFPAPGK